MILPVFRVRRVYRGSIFFSLVLILRISAYLGIKGDQFFSDLGFFFGACFRYKLVYYNLYHASNFIAKIECNEFVRNKFVSNLVQIDLILFEYTNCIRSIVFLLSFCHKANSLPISLIFKGSLYGAQNRGTNRVECKPGAGRLAWVLW